MARHASGGPRARVHGRCFQRDGKTFIRRGRPEIHRDQAIVKRFNRTLTERLFGHQFAVEMLLPTVHRLGETAARDSCGYQQRKNKLTDKKPAEAIKEKPVFAKPSAYHRPVGMKEKTLPSTVRVRYLFQPGELEGGTKRATDPVWSLKVFNIERMVHKPGTPVMYYMHDGPKRSFVREKLLVIPPDTQLPPRGLTT